MIEVTEQSDRYITIGFDRPEEQEQAEALMHRIGGVVLVVLPCHVPGPGDCWCCVKRGYLLFWKDAP